MENPIFSFETKRSRHAYFLKIFYQFHFKVQVLYLGKN